MSKSKAGSHAKTIGETPNPAKRPRSQAQIAQSRLNGQKSKGPATTAGKANSSQNAIRHGLTATVHTVLHNEVPAEYTAVYDGWVNDLRPATCVELRLVERLANLDWRQERLVFMETALLDIELALQQPGIDSSWPRIDEIGILALAWKSGADTSKSLDLVRRYLATLQSQFNSTLKNFRNLEQARLNPRRLRDADTEPPYRKPDLLPPPGPPRPHESTESISPEPTPSGTPRNPTPPAHANEPHPPRRNEPKPAPRPPLPLRPAA